MSYIVKAGETIELPEYPGVYATNAGDSADSITVTKAGVVEVGPEFLSDWTFTTASALVDLPTIKRG